MAVLTYALGLPLMEGWCVRGMGTTGGIWPSAAPSCGRVEVTWSTFPSGAAVGRLYIGKSPRAASQASCTSPSKSADLVLLDFIAATPWPCQHINAILRSSPLYVVCDLNERYCVESFCLQVCIVFQTPVRGFEAFCSVSCVT